MGYLPRGWSTVCAIMVIAFCLSLSGLAAAAPPEEKGKPGGSSCPVEGGAQVVLDPGHGGSDPGAIANGLVEKDLNLDIAYRVHAILEQSYSVAMTRYGDESLGNSERGDIATACGALVFVEIHFNASSDPNVNYTQTFWGKKRKDLEFSQLMSTAMNQLGIPNNGVGQFANGGLLSASMPSTLVECSFLTNPGEAALLADPEGGRRGQVATAIALGVQWWIG